MTFRLSAVLPAALCALLVGACATVRPPAGPVGAEDLARRVGERESRILSTQGKGSVSFESPEMAGSAYFAMALRKPDSLLVTLEGPFGIEAGFFFLSRRKFVVYNSFENRAIIGVPASGTIRGVIPMDLTLEEIMQAFTGGFRLPAGVPDAYGAEEENYRAVYRRDGRTESYWVDPASALVLHYEVRDSAGTVLFDAVSSRVTEKAGIPVPGHIAVTMPREGRRLTIHFTSIEVNGEDLSFEYAVPQNARITIR
jgi:hypothetical protein